MKHKIFLIIAFALAAVFAQGCSNDSSDEQFDVNAYNAGDRIPDKVLKSNTWAGYMDHIGGLTSILVYGPEYGYNESTWHFEHNVGDVYYLASKKLYLVSYSDYEKTANQIFNWLDLYLPEQPLTIMSTDYRFFFTPLLSPQIITDKNYNGVTFYSLTTPDKKRTYEIAGGTQPILLASFDTHKVLLPNSEGDLPVVLVDEDYYSKWGSGGSGGGSGGGSVPGTSRVSTEVLEIWVYTSGWNESVKSSTHQWYKAEINNKVCLFKSATTSDFLVASRNSDTEFKGYNVSKYRYKVVEPTITSGTNYYYFN